MWVTIKRVVVQGIKPKTFCEQGRHDRRYTHRTTSNKNNNNTEKNKQSFYLQNGISTFSLGLNVTVYFCLKVIFTLLHLFFPANYFFKKRFFFLVYCWWTKSLRNETLLVMTSSAQLLHIPTETVQLWCLVSRSGWRNKGAFSRMWQIPTCTVAPPSKQIQATSHATHIHSAPRGSNQSLLSAAALCVLQTCHCHQSH